MWPKSATRFGKKLPKSVTRFGKNSPKIATRLVQKVLKSKNLTVRTYHKLSRDKNEPEKWSKSAKKMPKRAKIRFIL